MPRKGTETIIFTESISIIFVTTHAPRGDGNSMSCIAKNIVPRGHNPCPVRGRNLFITYFLDEEKRAIWIIALL